MPVDQFIRDFACRSLMRQFECLGAEPLDVNDAHHRIRKDAANGGIRIQVFQR